jgi:hypothetical protein
VASLLLPDEFPKMILERQDFIDDRTSHRIDSIVLELKNRKTCLENLCIVYEQFRCQ